MYKLIATLAIMLSVGISLTSNLSILTVPIIILGIGIVAILNKRARKEGIVLKDEMIERIGGISAYQTLKIVIFMILFLGFGLKVLGNPLADIFLYTVVGICIIYLIIFYYNLGRYI